MANETWIENQPEKWFSKREKGTFIYNERYMDAGMGRKHWLGGNRDEETESLYHLTGGDKWILRQRHDKKPDTYNLISTEAASDWLKQNQYEEHEINGEAKKYFNDSINQLK